MKLRSAFPLLFALCLLGSNIIETPAQINAAAYDPQTQAMHAYANLPVAFVENRGQTDARVRYYAQGPRYGFYFTPTEVMLALVKTSSAPSKALDTIVSDQNLFISTLAPEAPAADLSQPGVALAWRFLGGNPDVVVEGADRASGEVNYFQGNDPAGWHTALPHYREVVYRELWPGVDLSLREHKGQLKYEFRVQPGARLADIRLAYAGADGLTLDGACGLLIQTAIGTLRDAPPVAYQDIAGVRIPVESQYALQTDGEYGFAVGAGYDPAHALIIDPGVEYSTFIGGTSHEYGAAIAVNAAGNAFIVGITQSPNFPTTSGAYDRSGAASNNLDVFVSKLNPTGTALVYSTFIGGTNFEWGRGLTIDAAGNAYIAGQTKSSNFPTTGGAFDRTFNVDICPRCGIDQYDAFVAKLNAAGSSLVYSTFLGGFDLDDALAIAVDGSGNAYVAGETGSLNFPITAGVIDTTRNGAFDAFVTKLNAAGSALVYSTYLGGAEVDYGGAIVVNSTGNAYVLGATRSPDFPTTAGAYDTTANGMFDSFVAKLNPTGTDLVYSTFLGGSDMDGASGLFVDLAGNAYIAGGTISADFPTTPGAYDTTLNSSDATITKLNATGSALVFSTFLGGSGSDSVSALALDAAGNMWLAGGTQSTDFPVTSDAIDPTFNGVGDVLLAQMNATGSALLYATYFGGTDAEGASDIAMDTAGNLYVTGATLSTNYPTTAGAFDRVFNGDPLIFWQDAFVTKFSTGQGASPTPTSPPPSPTPTTVPSSPTPTMSAPSATPTSTPTTSPPTPTPTTSSGTLPAPSLVSPAADARFDPGQSITFDWTDVSGAANYTIQIDNSQSFSAPLTLTQTVTASQFTTNTLPVIRMWWRVRANNAGGTPGNWSAVRRFEVKD